MNYTIRVAMIALATLTLAAPSHAQRSTARTAPKAEDKRHVAVDRGTSGLMIGVRTLAVPGLSIDSKEFNSPYTTTFGMGAGVVLGYGVNDTFSGYTSFDIAKQNSGPNESVEGSWGLAHFEIGARANLPLGGARTFPYVNASYGRRGLAARTTDEDGETADATISGKVMSIGGGIEHAISRSISLDGGVDVGFGKMENFVVDDDKWTQQVSMTRSIRMRVGVTWRAGTRGTT